MAISKMNLIMAYKEYFLGLIDIVTQGSCEMSTHFSEKSYKSLFYKTIYKYSRALRGTKLLKNMVSNYMM